MGGLLVDTLAYQFIGDWTHRDKSFLYYGYMCRDFFDYLAQQDTDQAYWRAPGSGQWVYGGKSKFQYKARLYHKLSLEAIEHETARPPRTWFAKQKWRDVFGSSFPS